MKPSITRKIHTSAATLITIGTVTKKPVMKLRLIVFSMWQSTTRPSIEPSSDPEESQGCQRYAIVNEHVEPMACQETQKVLDGQIADDRRDDHADRHQLETGWRQRHVPKLEPFLRRSGERCRNGQQ